MQFGTNKKWEKQHGKCGHFVTLYLRFPLLTGWPWSSSAPSPSPDNAKKRFLKATSNVPIALFFWRFRSRFWIVLGQLECHMLFRKSVPKHTSYAPICCWRQNHCRIPRLCPSASAFVWQSRRHSSLWEPRRTRRPPFWCNSWVLCLPKCGRWCQTC